MKKVISCIQPTGNLHLGNYFGAIQNWVNLQKDYNCLYGIANNHAMTISYKSVDLKTNTWNMVYQLLACGIEPKNLFIQSLIPEHTELFWILSCVTSYGELQKMTQFKDKRTQLDEKELQKELEKDKKNVNTEIIKPLKNPPFISTGLLMYPVLQAADILLYKGDYVPIGKDQEQHLELSRNIAARFNHQFGKDYFVHPKPLFTEIPKLLSIVDPNKKMSKSLGDTHCISLFENESKIRKQIKTATTDSNDINNSNEIGAGVKNLFTILKACGKNDLHNELLENYNKGIKQYGTLKVAVADALVELTEPFIEKLNDLEKNKNLIIEEITNSTKNIQKVAQQTILEVKDIVGIN